MTLRVIDGFDWLPPEPVSTAVYQVLYAAGGYYTRGASVIETRTGRFNFGQAFAVQTTGSGDDTHILPTGVSVHEGYMGIAVYRDVACTTDPFISFWDAAGGGPQLTVSFAANGIILLWRGWSYGGVFGPTPSVLLGQSAPGQFLDDQWFYAELHGVVNGTVGAIEVRINTVTAINLTGQNTQATGNTTFDSVALGDLSHSYYGPGGTEKFYAFDDMYFLDTAGAVNNTFLGNVRVFTQLTSAAGATTDLSIFGPQPTNWQTVQDRLLDDNQYVFTNVNGQFDLYKFQAIVTGTTIFGVQPRIAMRQDDATQVIADIVLATGAFTGIGSDKALNQTYTYYKDIWEENPDTSLPWTKTDTTLYQFGPKKKS